MTNKKNTRRALFMSALSLILCFAMLMGTTFAWFTDSVTSANNIIKSGNLDVELYYSVMGNDGKWIHFDYVPGEPDVRNGSSAIIGRLCVIGSHIDKHEIAELFGVEYINRQRSPIKSNDFFKHAAQLQSLHS